MKILSLFTHPHVISNLYDILELWSVFHIMDVNGHRNSSTFSQIGCLLDCLRLNDPFKDIKENK